MIYEGREIELRDCTKASVFSLIGEPITEASVYSVGEELRLVFEDDCYDELDAEERVIFYDGYLGLVICRCSIYGYRFERNERYQVLYGACCTILEVERVQQRRVDCKVKIEVPFTIEREGGSEDPIPALAADISAGGIGFFSMYYLQKGEIIHFSLRLGGKKLDLTAEILYRVENMEEKDKLMRYGCRFVKNRMGVENKIRQYVYQRQQRQIRGDII